MLVSSRLSIQYEVGMDDNGKSMYKTKSYSNIKNTATDAQLQTIVSALTPLQQYPVEKVERTNVHSL